LLHRPFIFLAPDPGDVPVPVPWTHPLPFRDSCRVNNQFHLIHTTPKQHSPKLTPADSKQKQTNPNPTEPTSYHSYSAVSKKIWSTPKSSSSTHHPPLPQNKNTYLSIIAHLMR
jgi:hypothetical protein